MRTSRRSGFTLFETLTTVVVGGVVAAVAIPRLDMTQLKADAAMYNVVLSFDVANNSMTVLEDKNNSGTYDTGDRQTSVALEDGVKFAETPAPLDGMTGNVMIEAPTLSAAAVAYGANTNGANNSPNVTFRRNGAASGSGAVFFKTKDGNDDSMRAVTLTKSTGRAKKYRLRASRWVSAES
jgi:prepilin-type N-terminal cleavage/methylation domain-containing protein